MMTIGPDRSRPVVDLIHEAKPHIMGELGCYIGYSAIMFGNEARQAGGKQYLSLEYNPEYAAVAQGLVDFAGLGDFVRILVGPSSDSLQKLVAGKQLSFDVLFIDHTEDLYLPDLRFCEQHGLLKKGSFVAADNVRGHRAKEYVNWINHQGQLTGESYASKSFSYALPDGFQVGCFISY